MSGILEGINVLDLSRILAGPYTAQMLSDLGANVTKIEAPWGDDTRGWGPPFATDFDGERVAAYFLCCNRGKSILQMNLKDEKERLMELIEWADVIVENFKPGTLERLLGELPKDVIICSISGYGATGPRRDEPGYDLALQARSGIMSITGEAEGSPVKVGVAWIDIITGLYAGNAILAALLDKERTGRIRHIDVSLWDCAIASLANQAQNVLQVVSIHLEWVQHIRILSPIVPLKPRMVGLLSRSDRMHNGRSFAQYQASLPEKNGAPMQDVSPTERRLKH